MQQKTTPYAADRSQPRRILVCVTGLSPQIVTETLYALCVTQNPPWVPDEIRLITTQRGASNATLTLLSDQPGWFQRLRQEWSLPEIAFDASHIEIIKGRDGQPLDDILDDTDNKLAADGISDLVRRLTEDDNTEVHASIAGGRKTMGFFMGYAMSLWGRAQDKLSHVLVSSPFEGRPEFFYPTRTSVVIPPSRPGQDPLDASTAKVWLGDIPFVRMRSMLPASITTQRSGFAEAVAAANQSIDHIELEIDIAGKCVRVNQKPVPLPPMQIAILCLLAWRAKQGLGPLTAPLKEKNDPEWKQEARHGFEQAMGKGSIPESLDGRLNDTSSMGEAVSEQISKMRKTLLESGTLPLAFERLIKRELLRANGPQGYSLNLKPEQVQIIRP